MGVWASRFLGNCRFSARILPESRRPSFSRDFTVVPNSRQITQASGQSRKVQRTAAVRCLPLFLLVCGLLQPASSRALDFHVNQAIGSDAATALQAQNPAEPWATIRHALRSVPDIGGPHTIHVAPGTYNESLESAYPGITLKGSPGTEEHEW